MTLDVGSINWLAVIVATIVYFVLGAIWYAPQQPIGRAWVAASGYQTPSGGAGSTNLVYAVPALMSFLAVVATALLARATGTDTLAEGVVLGLVVGIGYALTIMLTTATFEPSKPGQWTWGIVNAGYHAVGLLLAAIILALLR